MDLFKSPSSSIRLNEPVYMVQKVIEQFDWTNWFIQPRGHDLGGGRDDRFVQGPRNYNCSPDLMQQEKKNNL